MSIGIRAVAFNTLMADSHDIRASPTGIQTVEATGGKFAMIVQPACPGKHYAAASGLSVSCGRPVVSTGAAL